MVLRVLFLFLFAHSVHAQSFKKAGEAYFKGQYEKALDILDEVYDDEEMPIKAMELKALSEEGLKEFDEALKTYDKIINKTFSAADKRAMNFYQSDESSLGPLARKPKNYPEIPEKLLYYYYKISQVFSGKHTKALEAGRYEEAEKIFRQADFYARICERNNYDVETIEELKTKIDNEQTTYRARAYQGRWFLSLEYLSFQDQLEFIGPDGQDTELLATVKGLCAGFGHSWSNIYHELRTRGCYIYGTATVGEDTNFLNYFQDNVSINGLLGGAAYLFRPRSGQVAFGLEVPFMYRDGSFGVPDGGYSFDDNHFFSVGYMLLTEWRSSNKRWNFTIRYGKISQMAASIWALGGQYWF